MAEETEVTILLVTLFVLAVTGQAFAVWRMNAAITMRQKQLEDNTKKLRAALLDNIAILRRRSHGA